MGVPLFGVNISGLLYSATKGKLRPLTLTKYTPTTRDAANLAGGTRPTSTAHPGEGFIEDDNLINAGTGFRPDDNIVRAERIVTIIGDSLPAGVEPFGAPDNASHSDKITIEGETYTVIRVKGDPAKATYRCQVRR
jgi:hypothetical protein